VRQEIFDDRLNDQSRTKSPEKAKRGVFRSRAWWETQHDAWWVESLVILFVVSIPISLGFLIGLLIQTIFMHSLSNMEGGILLGIVVFNLSCISIISLTKVFVR